jgi:VIT1/CCC1 family predicted Fe2+/Mn2+ transporter
MSSLVAEYLPQFVYGSTDGLVTTFAIVSGAAGANLSPISILAIGIASVLADGYSMGISSYLSKQSETHFQSNGDTKSPLSVGIATFISFVITGMIPILPFLLPTKMVSFTNEKILSLILALISFFSIGLIKGIVRKDTTPIYSGIQTFVIGLSAAIIAYVTGYYVGG